MEANKNKISVIINMVKELEGADAQQIQSERLGEFLAYSSLLQSELELAEKKAKQLLVERKADDMMFPEVGKKIVLEDGRSSSSYDVFKLYDECEIMEAIDVFLGLVSVQQKNVDGLSESMKAMVEKHKTTTPGKPMSQISVRQLSKKDREQIELNRISGGQA